MIAEVVYTETYKFTLITLINNVESAYGTSSTEYLLHWIDRMVKQIVLDPWLFQAIPVDDRFRRAVISRQSSLVYEVAETRIILLYIFDNRQDPVWT